MVRSRAHSLFCSSNLSPVLFVHDLSDILLYSTKVFHYLDKYGKFYSRFFNALTQVCFFLFAVLFFWSRNWYASYVATDELFHAFEQGFSCLHHLAVAGGGGSISLADGFDWR